MCIPACVRASARVCISVRFAWFTPPNQRVSGRSGAAYSQYSLRGGSAERCGALVCEATGSQAMPCEPMLIV